MSGSALRGGSQMTCARLLSVLYRRGDGGGGGGGFGYAFQHFYDIAPPVNNNHAQRNTQSRYGH